MSLEHASKQPIIPDSTDIAHQERSHVDSASHRSGHGRLRHLATQQASLRRQDRLHPADVGGADALRVLGAPAPFRKVASGIDIGALVRTQERRTVSRLGDCGVGLFGESAASAGRIPEYVQRSGEFAPRPARFPVDVGSHGGTPTGYRTARCSALGCPELAVLPSARSARLLCRARRRVRLASDRRMDAIRFFGSRSQGDGRRLARLLSHVEELESGGAVRFRYGYPAPGKPRPVFRLE